ncbi:MAG: adenylate/guanylate cyclase domain-containing protein [Rhodoglobus sp.]
MSTVGPTPPPDDGAVLPAARTRAGLSIRSILLIMLLLVSIASSVVVGLIGYVNGRDSLQNAAYDRLVEVRDSRSVEMKSLFDSIENTLVLNSHGESVQGALQAYSAGFADLASADLSAADRGTIESYYRDTFAPKLAAADGTAVDASTFIPTGTAESYLKLHYTVPSTDVDKAIANDDAGDGSAWSAANAHYNDYFRQMVRLFKYQDVLLIDTGGNIVYSAYKGVDLGSNLDAGPLKRTNLAAAYAAALTSNVTDSVQLTDFAPYPPSLGTPAGWAVVPVAVNGTVIGAMAVELPIDRINSVMTGNSDWVGTGLGKTGETYLVGAQDNLMRSPSRDLIEHPGRYEAEAIAAGTPPEVAKEAVADKDTLLLQPVNTNAVTAAKEGKTGTAIIPDGYLGGETITAFAPLAIDGLDWVIIAEIDSNEAFAPVDVFTRNLVLSSAVIVLVVSLFSLLIAGAIVRPLRRLRDAARRIAAGEQGVQVDAGSSDELADVGAAFNDMSRSLQVKASLLEAQQAENGRLLLTLMPEPLIAQYKQGAQTIAYDHQEVTVMFGDIVGFEAFSRGLASEDSLEKLNEILHSFDEAADHYGIERVRTTRSGYLASCGLTIPRVDNARRMVDFSIELQRILERFGGKHGAELNLRAGLDTGTVTSGLVGQTHIAYDLWGDAVSLAFQIQGTNSEAGIFLTQAVIDRMPDTVRVRDWGLVTTASGEQRVWRIDPDDATAADEPAAAPPL